MRARPEQWWIVTDARGENPAALCSRSHPCSNVMRTFAISGRPDWQKQSWDHAARCLIDDDDKQAERMHLAVIERLTEPNRAAMYARKEAEARAVLAGDTSVAPLILTPEAGARGLSVKQLAPLVIERAEQDRKALARAWGWREAKRVREQV